MYKSVCRVPSSFDSQSMGRTAPCGNPKVVGSVNGCSAAEVGVGEPLLSLSVTPEAQATDPQGPSVTYTHLS